MGKGWCKWTVHWYIKVDPGCLQRIKWTCIGVEEGHPEFIFTYIHMGMGIYTMRRMYVRALLATLFDLEFASHLDLIGVSHSH